MYTGIYYNVMYVNYIYVPNKYTSNYYLENFKHKWHIGDNVKFRKPHKSTSSGIITNIAYSTEKFGGGTIKVYLINNKWIEESYIKTLIK